MLTEEWKDTLWNDLDIETMDMECKKLSKDVRGFDKSMRDWQTLRGLETQLKNMLTSLRAIGSLQNPAIRKGIYKHVHSDIQPFVLPIITYYMFTFPPGHVTGPSWCRPLRSASP